MTEPRDLPLENQSTQDPAAYAQFVDRVLGALEKPGDFIGPYKLFEIIGEGGFGVVWLAERREPMVQRVALKIIKPGMDSKSVIARFEQERQALAVMDHPNVAKVLDGGVTPAGRPYFVMELVKGEPITAFCDRQRLTIRQRLELFIPVCEAVQHAHHKGLIHRDLKPSNILVAMHEGRASPKVIDFGVAKAISHTLAEATVFTEQGRLIGTPEYMSPEQAEMGATDVDTRTDIYSLGVVLYQLLVGVVPFDSRMLRAAGLDAIRRMIREQEVPRPSTRLSTLDDPQATGAAAARQIAREELAKELRRELEWIPLKCLRKDRGQRYTTPMDLAKDIDRYLHGQALEAGPESTSYKVGKLLRRHRGAVIAGSAVVVALILGIAGTTVGLLKARESAAEAERRRAVADAFGQLIVEDIVQNAVDSADPAAAQTLSQAAKKLPERFARDPETLASLSASFADALVRAGDSRTAVTLLESARAASQTATVDPETRASIEAGLADAKLRQAADTDSVDDARAAVAEGIAKRGRVDPVVMTLRNNLAGLIKNSPAPTPEAREAAWAEAEKLYNDVLEDRIKVLGAANLDTLITRHNILLIETQRCRAAFRALGSDPTVAAQKARDDVVARFSGALLRRATLTADTRAALGPARPQTLASWLEEVALRAEAGRLQPDLLESALGDYPKLLEQLYQTLGIEHWRSLEATGRYGQALGWAKRNQEALDQWMLVLGVARSALGLDHPTTRFASNAAAELLGTLSRPESEEFVRLRAHADATAAGNGALARARANELAEFYVRENRPAEAETWRARGAAPAEGGSR